jgi:NAD-dependent dihydropyrimidine dehydrogenase PreA subunit
MVVKVDEAKCNGDGICKEQCPLDCFEMQNDKAVLVRPDDCTDCGICVEGCPTQAITL